MTEKQAQVYQVIDEWWKKFGFAPSVDDIMEQTNSTSRGSIHGIMKQLCELGYCRKLPRRARSIKPSYLKVHQLGH